MISRGNYHWKQRFRKASLYVRHRDWSGLRREIKQFLVWKGLIPADIPNVPFALKPLQKEALNEMNRFEAFLAFEGMVFGSEFPIPAYDPYLIRYGEYQFALEMLSLQPGEVLLDMGSGANIFVLFLAYLGIQAIAVDLDPQVEETLQQRRNRVEQVLGSKLNVRFLAEDALHLTLEDASVDEVIAISSIEHMFSAQGPGDVLAIEAIARVLKPGGVAVITLPTGKSFCESPCGDERFGGPYRLYTPPAIRERILSHPELKLLRLAYLVHQTPDPRYDPLFFHRFWTTLLTPEERKKWAWANAILANVFNPIVPAEEGEQQLESVNTALICLKKLREASA